MCLGQQGSLIYSFYLLLMNGNLNLKSHRLLVTTTLESTAVYIIEVLTIEVF